MKIGRRKFLARAFAASGALAIRGASAQPENAWRFATTPVFLDDHAALLNEWGAYLAKRTEQPIRFVQRRSYRDITQLLLEGSVDAAWICGAPFVQHSQRLRLVAVPLFQDAPLYRSYVIARKAGAVRQLVDLKGRTFAFSDPDSNSGHHVPRYRIRELGHDPSSFFGRTFFTYGHRKVIEAVAAGLAEGGAVDGYVWETLALRSPALVERTRVIDRSAEYGFPPIVTPVGVDARRAARFGDALREMRDDRAGRSLLDRLNLSGFGQAPESLFGGIRQVLRELNALA